MINKICLLAVIISLGSSFVLRRNARKLILVRFSLWGYDDDTSFMDDRGSKSGISLPALSDRVVEELEKSLGSMATSWAIDTVGYYMLEFKDDVSERWMNEFCGYKEQGTFPSNDWTTYIEKMINTEKQTVEVIMRTHKSLLRGKHAKEGANVVLRYEFDLEPRKIANQIITVREDVCNEMMNDLTSMKNENSYALEYAEVMVRSGKEAAEKARRLTRNNKRTRMNGQGGSTPHRDRNYLEASLFITSKALDVVRAELTRTRDEPSLKFLQDVLDTLQKETEARDRVEQELALYISPRSMLELLCYEGVCSGVQTVGGKSLNKLKITNMVLNTRLALCDKSIEILRAQSFFGRRYYKMIQDRGGFKKFDLKTPKVTILDLDEEERLAKEAAERAACTKAQASVDSQGVSPSISPAAAMGSEGKEVHECSIPSPPRPPSGVDEESDDEYNVDFRRAGPVLM